MHASLSHLWIVSSPSKREANTKLIDIIEAMHKAGDITFVSLKVYI